MHVYTCIFQIDSAQNSLKQLNLTRSETESDRVKDVPKFRSKRPEIQRYVPKPKILEQQQRDTEDESDDLQSLCTEDRSPRKVDVKENLKGFQITVVNDRGPNGTEADKSEVKGQGKEKDSQRSATPSDPVNPLSRTDDDVDNSRSKGKNLTSNSSRSGSHPEQKVRGQRENYQAGRYDQDKGREKYQRGGRRGPYEDRGRHDTGRNDGELYHDRGKQDAGRNQRGSYHDRGKQDTGRNERLKKGDRSEYDGGRKGNLQDGRNQPGNSRNQGFQKNRNLPQQSEREDSRSSPQQSGWEESGGLQGGREEVPKPQRGPRERRDRRTNEKSEAGTDKEGGDLEADVIPTMVFERTDSTGQQQVDWKTVMLLLSYSALTLLTFFGFLVHLSRRLKCTIVITRCPSSVVRC